MSGIGLRCQIQMSRIGLRGQIQMSLIGLRGQFQVSIGLIYKTNGLTCFCSWRLRNDTR
jgi:hypothetical protein